MRCASVPGETGPYGAICPPFLRPHAVFARTTLEAFEMVEKGFVTGRDFREFTFTNTAMLHTRNHPGFFKGTVVEQAVAAELGLERAWPPPNA